MKHHLLSASMMLLCCAACTTSRHANVSAPVADIVWEAYDGFNRQFLDSARYIYKNTTDDKAAVDRWGGAAAIWCQPMYADMAINAMVLARDNGDKQRYEEYRELANKIIDGNIAHYLNFDFDNNDTNRGWFIYDDIQWWTITLARAAKELGRDDLRTLAERSFARVWYGSPRVGDTGSYADPAKGLGGGMFWQWQPLEHPAPNEAGHGKMSCINFPTVVAAMLLHDIVPADRKADPSPETWTNGYGSFIRPHYETRDRYLEMAREIFDWSAANLTDTVTGMVHDHRHGDHASGHPLIYNQGTYIGGAALLYKETGDETYLKHARRGADYSINVMSGGAGGYLPWARNEKNPYDQGSLEQGVYPAIWAQYMKLLTDSCGQTEYGAWIERNGIDGWANRDRSRGIADGESGKPTPSDALIGSYAASSVPAMLLLYPPKKK